jgi:hypothetical protein
MLTTREQAKEILEDALPRAATKMVELLDNPNVVVAQRAADQIFDRTVGKPTQRVAVQESEPEREGPLARYGRWLTQANPALAEVWVARITAYAEGAGPRPELPVPPDSELARVRDSIDAWIETLRPGLPETT